MGLWSWVVSTYRRGEDYLAVTISTIGLAVGAYVALVPYLFPDKPPSTLEIFGVSVLAVLVSCAINYQAFGVISAKRRQVSALASAQGRLREQVLPVLWGALDRFLSYELKELLKIGRPEGDKARLNMYVFIRVANWYRIVASTEHPAAQVRRIALEADEGVVGLAAGIRQMMLVDLAEDPGRGSLVGAKDQTVTKERALTAHNRDKIHDDLRWVLAVPIFRRSPAVPYDDTIQGVLTVDGYADGDGEIMQTLAFKQKAEGIANDVSDFLKAYGETELTELRT